MVGKNWMGQDSHQVDDYCWFKTTPEEREELRELFDTLTKESYSEELLIKLLDKVRTTAREEAEFFSQGD